MVSGDGWHGAETSSRAIASKLVKESSDGAIVTRRMNGRVMSGGEGNDTHYETRLIASGLV